MNVHPYSAASPDLDSAAMKDLTNSIRAHGQLVPILVWRGTVVDGRKRLACCEAIGIEPKIETLRDEADAARVAVDANVLRTHYTASQRAMFAATIATAAKSDGRRFADARETSSVNLSKLPLSNEQAGSMLGVGAAYVVRAKKIKRTAAPAVVDAVNRGHLTLHAAEKIVKGVPVDDQPRVTATVVAQKTGARNATSKVINAAAPGIVKPPRRDAFAAVERGINAMLATAEGMEGIAIQTTYTDDQRAALASTINHVLRLVRKIERAITQGERHERSA